MQAATPARAQLASAEQGRQTAAATPSGADAPPTNDSKDDDVARAPAGARRWQMEIKRQSTNRGTDSESTKTTLRIEAIADGPISLWRLDIPLPDETTDFEGSPFNPRLGDIKVRAGLKSFDLHGAMLSP